MEINWEKWIVESLPFRLRSKVICAFCFSLVSPVLSLYNDFDRWRAKMKIKAGGSPQVCMLKKVVYDELGVNIEIEEGNGKPHDFIIQIALDMDKERQLFALLDRYKLAGKSYLYDNTDVSINLTWGAFVCEIADTSWAWGGFVCEAIVMLETTITIGKGDDRSFTVKCSPDAYPYAYVEISYYCRDEYGIAYRPEPYLYRGPANATVRTPGSLVLYPSKPNDGFSIYPDEDETHIYTLKVEIL